MGVDIKFVFDLRDTSAEGMVVDVSCEFQQIRIFLTKYNKAKALSILAHKLGRALYFTLKNKEVFQKKFLR